MTLTDPRPDDTPDGAARLASGLPASKIRDVAPQLSHVWTDGPERDEVESFLNRIYAEKYGARLSSHFPHFLCARDKTGRLSAVIGFRFLRHHDAFLQQYLDEPVETAVARVIGKPVARMQIVEMGSFASTGANIVGLFAELARYLHTAGAGYAVATSTQKLLRCFRSLGMETRFIAPADPSRLADSGASWGTYYGTDPKVVAGDIMTASARLAAFASSITALKQLPGFPV
ncbi:thermostable hemolysin [Hyphomonas sp.]|uniref:thermostable hemolysin n=1 Tax=Hyphomonas sp. TaxID=87 RepID=UPI001D2F967F|nr:thermostable hemolysin [Hyphomonas sp.]MBU3920393.1 thermostable hemolysin [Alphaproteobacteria bacterium]MBU4063766.1 thermostable hemolysin [Alphaproteobacteria bacterium]